MTESDKLLSKADALLARRGSGVAVPRPPTDYPVLTEVVKASTGDSDAGMPKIPPKPDIPVLDTPAAGGGADARALEERVRLRVLEAIEPYVRAILEEPLRLRIEQLARELAENIARDTRNDILTLVRDAVQSAVARELDARRDERSGSR
jgi:hypothetical protein